ncbi:na+/H+ antiporter family protein, partial [Vibrio parahaemolyticus 3256]
FGFD